MKSESDLATIFELRDQDEARRYVLQGLWLARAMPLNIESLQSSLNWCTEILAEGNPLPPVGFVLDVGHVAQAASRYATAQPLMQLPPVDQNLLRRYEDHVLGKFYADMSFERGTDAIARYQLRDRDRSIAYLINQARERADFGGAIFSPGVLKSIASQPAEDTLREAWDWMETDSGFSPQLTATIEEMIHSIRAVGELLAKEDIFELEHGTALAQFGQRLALRQSLRAATLLENNLSRNKPRSLAKSHAVATNLVDEDFYPVGGFSSISNKGTIESLLRSELAYIEDDESRRPDLFDIRYVRDELLYYSRDENQFFRQRRTLIILLRPDLVAARFKDHQLPWQRVIMMIAMIQVAIHRLIDWLSSESLVFQLAFVTDAGASPLVNERMLLETLFREEIASAIVQILELPNPRINQHCQELAKRSRCQVLDVTCGESERFPIKIDGCVRLNIDAAIPTLLIDDEPQMIDSFESATEAWQIILLRCLQNWI